MSSIFALDATLNTGQVKHLRASTTCILTREQIKLSVATKLGTDIDLGQDTPSDVYGTEDQRSDPDQ